MKRSKEIIGLPVISIAGGVQIGTIKGMVVNPHQKTVEFLLLDEHEGNDHIKGIPFRYAEGVGEYAVTVENASVPFEIPRIGILQELMERGIAIIGTKVITRKGKYLGDASEFSLDPESGNLQEIYYQEQNAKDVENKIPLQRVITLGKEVLVVEEPEAAQLAAGEALTEENKINFSVGNERSSGEQLAAQPATGLSVEEAVLQEREMLTSQLSDDLDPADTFIQKQRQFLIGKTLLKDLQSQEGEIIAWENEVVTEELFEKVYKFGAQKIMELAISVRE